MQENKIRQTIIPPLFGLIIAFILLYALTQVVNQLIHPCDGDETFDFPYLTFYIITFFPAFLITFLFQSLIALRIWEVYKQRKKIINLSLWQLIFLSSLVFGASVGYWHWQSFHGFIMLLFYIFSITLISIAYWSINLYTLKYLDKKQNGG